MDDHQNSATASIGSNPFAEVPVEVTISVGQARPAIRDLIALRPDSVLKLNKKIDEPVELFIGERLFARGELQELDGENAGQLVVKIIEMIEEKS
jgi:flagellar motor switch protein FliN/FliY